MPAGSDWQRRMGAVLRGTILLASITSAAAADPSPGIVGKDGWLFYRYEAADLSTADTITSVQLITRISRVLARNDVTLAVALVPVKMRIYAEHLPADYKLTPYMAGQYDRLAKALRAGSVHFIDLNSAFMQSALRAGDTPLFYRLDTHWSPSGAMLAAETIKAGIDADPALARQVDALPVQKYRVSWDDRKKMDPANDLVPQLPKGSGDPGQEAAMHFYVARETPSTTGLLDEVAGPGITLLGSSYSADWTQFPNALRYALQREVLSLFVPANQGSWVGFESYLRDDAFQTRRPKLILWEVPERDMQAPPRYKYRDARYNIDNTEWLLRAAAWATAQCAPARSAVKARAGTLGAGPEPSQEGKYVELRFDRPLDKLEYLSARLTTEDSTSVTLEASGAGATTRRFTLPVAGDEAAHAFRTPLYAGGGKGFDKVRLYPGNASRFSLEDVQVCRQMEDLLK